MTHTEVLAEIVAIMQRTYFAAYRQELDACQAIECVLVREGLAQRQHDHGPAYWPEKAGMTCMHGNGRLDSDRALAELVRGLGKRIMCLHLELEPSIANDVQRAFDALFDYLKGSTSPCPFCVGRIGRVVTTCEDCQGSGVIRPPAPPATRVVTDRMVDPTRILPGS